MIIFATCFRKRHKTYCSIDSLSPPEKKRAKLSILGLPHLGAGFPYLKVACGELEADDLFNHLKLKSQQDKMDKKAREKIISSFRGNYATCYVNQSTKV